MPYVSMEANVVLRSSYEAGIERRRRGAASRLDVALLVRETYV
jgi:hypothetical protein